MADIQFTAPMFNVRCNGFWIRYSTDNLKYVLALEQVPKKGSPPKFWTQYLLRLSANALRPQLQLHACMDHIYQQFLLMSQIATWLRPQFKTMMWGKYLCVVVHFDSFCWTLFSPFLNFYICCRLYILHSDPIYLHQAKSQLESSVSSSISV